MSFIIQSRNMEDLVREKFDEENAVRTNSGLAELEWKDYFLKNRYVLSNDLTINKPTIQQNAETLNAMRDQLFGLDPNVVSAMGYVVLKTADDQYYHSRIEFNEGTLKVNSASMYQEEFQGFLEDFNSMEF